MTRPTIDFNGLADKIRSMKTELCPDTLIMHPNTLAKIIPLMESQIPDRWDRMAFRLSIKTDELMPEKSLKERWHPPAGGRFFELTEEDEAWARPLGLGTVEQIDCGPLIYAMSQRMFSMFTPSLFTPIYPRSIIYGSC